MGFIGSATDQCSLGFEGQVKHVHDTHGLVHDFSADAVAGQDEDFHVGVWSCGACRE